MPDLRFADILESVDNLPLQDQEDLLGILQNRLRDRLRAERIRDVHEAEAEYNAGQCSPVTPDELMEELLS